MNRKFLSLLSGFILFAAPSLSRANPQEEYFEVNVRPLLAKRCFECHGEKKQESDVRMDRKASVMKGGASGPLVEPGKVNSSRLWQVLQHSENDVAMPPKEKMPPEELAVIQHWIEQGAYWPDDKVVAGALGGQPRLADGTFDYQTAVQQHWSYRPIQNPAIPEPKEASLCKTPIDRFLASKMEEKGLTFSPLASRETLIRRIALDLVGVPPTIQEVQEFVNDTRPDALEVLIDKYLADPRYGERWGRHWLDIARYADTKGYVFNENRNYAFAYTYRDYVIRAFNEDLPYNQFILEQLAADQLGYPENDPRLAALGFLTVGNRFLNRVPDIIDDRIDVVTRGLMGMTAACARCHDHKYDPITSADYYALYGVFNSSQEPELGPVIGQIDEQSAEYQAFATELAKREEELKKYIDTNHANLRTRLTDQAADCVLGAAKLFKLIPEENIPYTEKEPRIKLLERWKAHITQRTNDKTADPIWAPWKILMAIPDAEFAAKSEEALKSLSEQEAIPAPLRSLLESSPPKSKLEVAQLYGKCFAEVVVEWKKTLEQNAEATELADAGQEQIRKTLFGPGSVSDLPESQNSPLFERDQLDQIRNLKAKVNQWYAESPGAPPRAMVMLDKEKPGNSPIFLRGDPNRRGPVVPRRTPRVLTPEKEQPFQNGSGRLELAQSIINPANPLTARVIVNRVWGYHFGSFLVDSSSDFGSRADVPLHPELLDWLAWNLTHEDQWSIKKLHRRIMLSHAYLQSSVNRPDQAKIDPQNVYYWRQNRQRMDFEAMRDSMLYVAKLLETTVGGRASKLDDSGKNRRRTVYAFIDRNNLPALFRTFDYPSPDASSPGRPLTTVPQQALFLMNSPFVESIATQLAEQVRQHSSEPDAQAKELIQQVYSRPAEPEEIQMLSSFLEKHPLEQLTQALLMTNEFMFVD